MAPKTAEDAFREVSQFIEENGRFLDFYADVARDAQHRLTTEHNLPPGTRYIVVECDDAEAARDVAFDLHAEGCTPPQHWEPVPPPPDEAANQVYAYQRVEGITDP